MNNIMNILFEYLDWTISMGYNCAKYCYDAIYDNIKLVDYVLNIQQKNDKYIYSKSLFEFEDIDDDEFIICDYEDLR